MPGRPKEAGLRRGRAGGKRSEGKNSEGERVPPRKESHCSPSLSYHHAEAEGVPLALLPRHEAVRQRDLKHPGRSSSNSETRVSGAGGGEGGGSQPGSQSQGRRAWTGSEAPDTITPVPSSHPFPGSGTGGGTLGTTPAGPEGEEEEEGLGEKAAERAVALREAREASMSWASVRDEAEKREENKGLRGGGWCAWM